MARSQDAADEADHRRRRLLLVVLATLLGLCAMWWLGDLASTSATDSSTASGSSDSSRRTAYAWFSGARPIARVRVSPSAPGRHESLTVAFHSRRATGDFEDERRTYTVQAWSLHPAPGCVNNRDRVLAPRPAGYQLRGRLDPARGDGGGLGWCPGHFKGKVIYAIRYACPAKGTCRPPKDFRGRREVDARFSFRVP